LAGRASIPLRNRAKGSAAPRVLYYVDPMHPAYRSNRPGKAPDCGMDLEPVYDGTPAQSSTAANLVLTPDQEQAGHFETETLQAAAFTKEVLTVGRVAPDEALTYTVSAGVDGWVRTVFSDRTGSRVSRGQALATFYSKDISAPQQAYVYALESYERLQKQASPPAESLALATQQLTTARDNLLFAGMGEAQMEDLARTRREAYALNLTAPADGLILERRVAVGERFMRGELLYRIAGLASVWVLADIHSGEAALVGTIRKAQIRVEGLPPLDGRISPVPPQFDERGRTGKLRLEVNNARGFLVPGMIVDVVLHFAPRSAITVPVDAVIDSGTRQHVFVALNAGRYELREVETGVQERDRVEILSGLEVGEHVVTAGAFLLDSESRLKNAATEGKLKVRGAR
jgi:Cu(I)/Ag(I) efflux system membrane fusion protein